MSSVIIDLDDALAQVLGLLDQPVEQAVRDLVVVELYRRQIISGGKAAELLGMSKREFIQYSGRLGIPFFRLTNSELDAEMAQIKSG